MSPDENNQTTLKMPRFILWTVVVLSVAPLLLTLVGANFGSDLSAAIPDGPDQAYRQLSGAFVHTIYEWMAVSIALLTAILALLHYAEKGEITTPILGLALCVAGAIDTFHIFGADRLVSVQSDPDAFMALTWLVSRTFLGATIFLGAIVFPMTEPNLNKDNRRRGFGAIVLATVAFSLVAFLLLHTIAGKEALPALVHPDAFLHRPWNLLPAGLFLVLGLYVLPTYYLWRASVFTHALIISMIPHSLAELHMALGSGQAFDHHFVVAHFLKALAYSIPLMGLMLDYRVSHGMQMKSEEDRASEFFVRKQTEEALTRDRTILRLLLNEIDQGVMIKDSSSRIVRINKAMASILGLEGPHDAVGRTEKDLWELETAEDDDRSVLDSGSPTEPRTQTARIGDRTRTVETIRLPLKNDEGNAVGVLSIVRGTE